MSSPSNISPAGRKMQDRMPGQSVTGQGLARNPSFRSSRPVRKAPIRSSISGESGVPDDDDAKAASAQLIADLKQQVERAEQASETYRRQLDAMQKQLDDASNQTTAAEEREFQFRTRIDKLEAQLKDSARQNRELEMSYDSETKMLLQDKEMQSVKQAELHSMVSRLTENLKFKNQELASTNKMMVPEATQPADEFLDVIRSKDTAIETLRLEIADLQLKMAEQEHMGDGKWQGLEKELVEIKMKNARLQEENESFEMLLSERTIKGDFMTEQPPPDSKPVSSLAEELESAGEHEISPDTYRMMEAENKTLRDSNKALTLYIDKIIGRLLQHEGFERIITDKDDTSEPKAELNKALPEPPVSPRKVSAPAAAVETATNMGASLLQRARSVVARPPAPKPRPVSLMPTANENPQTAPSIPISRTHRRARSDQANDIVAATVIQTMNRGQQLRTTSNGPISPGISPMSPMSAQRQSYFGPPARSSTTPVARPDSSSNSMVSEHSLEGAESTDASSARASVMSNAPAPAAAAAVPGAVMKQSQLRPLRLVQERALNDEEQKKANRGSWMNWFQKGAVEASQQEQ